MVLLQDNEAMRHFIENHTEPNTTVAQWKEAIKTSFGLTYYNDMMVEVLAQYVTQYWVHELQDQLTKKQQISDLVVFCYPAMAGICDSRYGSSRTSTKLSTGLGSVQRNLPLVQQVLNSDSLLYHDYSQDSIRYFYRGQKRYELSNHLGNVLAVISDRRIEHCDAGDLSYYVAQVVSVSDYYPFGMEIKERSWSVSSYRYGFQGQLKDNEVKGEGNSIEYKYRVHDTRLGRFLSVDPLMHEFVFNSPYAFSENRVIDACELEGLESSMQWKTIGDGFAIWYESMASIFKFEFSQEFGFMQQEKHSVSGQLLRNTKVSVGVSVGNNVSNFIKSIHQFGTTSEPLVKTDIFFKSSLTDYVSISSPPANLTFSNSSSTTYSYSSMKTSTANQEKVSLNMPAFKFGLELTLLETDAKSNKEFNLNLIDFSLGSENKSMFNAKASTFFETQKSNTTLGLGGISNSIGISCSVSCQIKVGESPSKNSETITSSFIFSATKLKIGLNL
jgi:RHS repeat-associated protein